MFNINNLNMNIVEEKTNIDEDPIPEERIRDKTITLTVEEYTQKLQADKQKLNHLKEMVAREKEIADRNHKKLLMEWRNIIAAVKVEDLRKEFDILANEFQRNLDTDDAFILVLDKRLEDSHRQYQMALKNHIMHLDRFTHLREHQVKDLRNNFEKQLEALYDEFAIETEHILQEKSNQIKNLEDMIESIKGEEKRKSAIIRENFQQFKEELKDRATEEIEIMQVS